jgi:adenylate kinase family enzyme
MSPKTFIIYGSSGCGKGTQARLLMDYLKKIDTAHQTLYIETGQRFRDFITEASYTAAHTKEIIDAGGLLPEFLPIWIWSEYFVRHVSGNEHLILDGLSRRVHEAPILDSAMKFYKREKPYVLFLDVSREWAKERLMNRGRGDDNTKDIEPRLDWFEKNVVPAMEYFRNNPGYEFITIQGEQSIEDVHKEIVEKLKI